MVTYDYRCMDCKHEFQVRKSMNDSSKKENCPNCKCKKTVKIIKPLTIIYKGKGFTKSSKHE